MPSQNSKFKHKISAQHDFSSVFDAAGPKPWEKLLKKLAKDLVKAGEDAKKVGKEPEEKEREVVEVLLGQLENTLKNIAKLPNDFHSRTAQQQQRWLDKQQHGFEQIHREIDDISKLLTEDERKKFHRLPAYGANVDYRDPTFQKLLSNQMLTMLKNDRIREDIMNYLRSMNTLQEKAGHAQNATETYLNNMKDSAISDLEPQLMHAKYTPQGYLGQQVTKLLMNTMFWLASFADPKLAEDIEPEAKKGGPAGIIPMKM